MLDVDLADLYQVPTKRLNEQVKRNIDRFPGDFMFQLGLAEFTSLNRSQIATGSQKHRDPKYLPYAFTELGVAMLSSVLNSEKAVQMNILIMRTFVKIRQLISGDKDLVNRFNKLELDLLKQGGVLTDLYTYVKKFMDTPIPLEEKIGFNVGK